MTKLQKDVVENFTKHIAKTNASNITITKNFLIHYNTIICYYDEKLNCYYVNRYNYSRSTKALQNYLLNLIRNDLYYNFEDEKDLLKAIKRIGLEKAIKEGVE